MKSVGHAYSLKVCAVTNLRRVTINKTWTGEREHFFAYNYKRIPKDSYLNVCVTHMI